MIFYLKKYLIKKLILKTKMDPSIEEEIMRNHNQAEAFISLFFAGLDAVCYIIILTLFGCDFNSFQSPKQKLTLLIVLDAVLRIINMYTDEYSKYFIKEVFFSLFSTLQFNIIITCLNQIFTDKSIDSSLENELEIRNINIFTGLFFVLIFSFKGIFLSYKLISTLQYICIIIGIYILSKYIGRKIEIYLANVVKKDSSFSGENFVNNMPFFISIYFILNFCFELLSLLIEHKLYASYMIMLCKIFKEVGKYLVFLLLIIIYHTFNKYMVEDDFGFSVPPTIEPKEQEHPTEKTKVNIYKDEDEYDDA